MEGVSPPLIIMCTSPRLAYKKTNGQYTLTALGTNAPIKGSVAVPCGICMECRITKARDWSTRMVLESKMHSQNSFITLTVADEHRSANKSLNKEDPQKFLKRLRKHLWKHEGIRIRYYLCGEYGETTAREHYHLCIFGWNPEDRKFFKLNKTRDKIYTSETLQKLWDKGFVTVGNFTPQTAEYCAKYITKAIIGTNADNTYTLIDPETGETSKRTPPFQTSSRNPGLASTWYDKYQTDAYPYDFIVIDGKKRKVPPYFDKKLKKTDPIALQAIKRVRTDTGNEWVNRNKDTQKLQHLQAKKVILSQKLHLRKRDAS